MKVHFGGSILGLRKYTDHYRRIREEILNLGHELTRDWIPQELSSPTIDGKAMYDLTEKAVKRADAIVLECSHDTSTIGQQMLLALENNLPVLLLFPAKTNKKSSFLGNFISLKHQEYLKKENYDDINISKTLGAFFSWAKNNLKYARFNLVIEKELDSYLRDRAHVNRTSKTEEIRKLIRIDMKKRKRA